MDIDNAQTQSPSEQSSSISNTRTVTQRNDKKIARVAFMITSSQKVELQERLGYEATDIKGLTPMEALLILEHDIHRNDYDETEASETEPRDKESDKSLLHYKQKVAAIMAEEEKQKQLQLEKEEENHSQTSFEKIDYEDPANNEGNLSSHNATQTTPMSESETSGESTASALAIVHKEDDNLAPENISNGPSTTSHSSLTIIAESTNQDKASEEGRSGLQSGSALKQSS
jgi:hypothetical protein